MNNHILEMYLGMLLGYFIFKIIFSIKVSCPDLPTLTLTAEGFSAL